ncbi:MAG: MFS transporter, partial [Gammaproteobacteria bacterium]
SASTAVSLFFLTGGITGLYVARSVQRHDVRISFCVGALVSGLGLASLAYVQTLAQLFAAYMLLGAGFAASALIPATTLVTRWFTRRRAMALSIASTGLSLGGVVLTPLCVVMVETLGFERAVPLIGLMYVLGVVPVTIIWLRPSPAAMGLTEPGVASSPNEAGLSRASTANSSTSHISIDGTSFGDALRSRFFWGASAGYIFLMMAQVGGIAHQYGLAREQLNEAETAFAVAILPVGSIVGRLIGGWVVERISMRAFAIFVMIMQAASLLLLSTGFSPLTLYLGLALFGTTVGNLLMLQPLIVAAAFGVRDYARIFSVSNQMTSWGTAIGPALLGLAYGLNNNQYSLSYQVAALAGALGLVLFLAGGRKRL